jgi:hypothetical protein
MSKDGLTLLREFRSGVPAADEATAQRVRAFAVTKSSKRSRVHRRRIALGVVVVAAALVGGAVAAVTLLGQPAPQSVQADIHRSAVLLFAGHPGLVKATARVLAESPDATLYGISDRDGNYCVELVGASKGLVWSFSCDQGWRIGNRYVTPGLATPSVTSIVVDGKEPPVVWWGLLASGTSKAEAIYPDGTTEQIELGDDHFFVYQPGDRNQPLARRVPVTIRFLRADGSPSLSSEVLPPQPLDIRGTTSGTISGRVLISGAVKVKFNEWGTSRRPLTHYIPLGPDGTFTLNWKRSVPFDLHIVDRNNKELTDYLQAVPEKFWRSLVNQARSNH